jgi:hypothetical protein
MTLSGYVTVYFFCAVFLSITMWMSIYFLKILLLTSGHLCLLNMFLFSKWVVLNFTLHVLDSRSVIYVIVISQAILLTISPFQYMYERNFRVIFSCTGTFRQYLLHIHTILTILMLLRFTYFYFVKYKIQ